MGCGHLITQAREVKNNLDKLQNALCDFFAMKCTAFTSHNGGNDAITT